MSILSNLVSLALIGAILAPTAQDITPEQEQDMYLIAWESCNDEVRQELPIEYLAAACGMTESEFEYLARTVEAESDRTDSLEGKIHIAAVILNRVNSSLFPNSITAVLDDPGQFETTYNSWCSTPSTQTSRWAIVEAQRRLVGGDIPDNLLFFNSIGYNYGQAYGYIDGNYFMTY